MLSQPGAVAKQVGVGFTDHFPTLTPGSGQEHYGGTSGRKRSHGATRHDRLVVGVSVDKENSGHEFWRRFWFAAF